MTATTAPSAVKPVLTGRRMFFIFAAFFGTIASADAFLVASAVRTWSGTEATSPYKAGQLYNGRLAEARAQDARGWRITPTVSREPDGSVRVEVTLRDRAGAPLAGETVTVTLERPTDKRADRGLDLTEAAPGTYAAVGHDLAPGQWDLVVDVLQGAERSFRRKSRVVLR
ncbi:MAG TPA: FixH family protein [Microvirga sp.]|nr:FixH family protein [Microvirga sp.]